MYDDRYGFPGKFDLVDCAQCGHRRLLANFTSAQLEVLYSSYYPRATLSLEDWRPYTEIDGWPAWFNGERGYAFRWVPRNVRVLDIGCGFGQTLGYHRNRGCEAHGVEADSNILRVAERYGLNARVGLFDPKNYAADYFDYVTLDQVIEHVNDPIEVLSGVARVLRKGGMALLSTPNSRGWGARLFGRRWINWHVPYHVQQFSKRSMELAAQRAGLKLVDVKTITSSEWLFYQWLHLLSMPGNGDPSYFWAPHPLKDKFLQRKIVRFTRSVHGLRFNHWVTRLFDTLGIGDNQLFFLQKT